MGRTCALTLLILFRFLGLAPVGNLLSVAQPPEPVALWFTEDAAFAELMTTAHVAAAEHVGVAAAPFLQAMSSHRKHAAAPLRI